MLGDSNAGKMRAIQVYTELKKAWAETDRLLNELVRVGKISDLVYSFQVSEANLHMVALKSALYRPDDEVNYHAREARRDLQASRDLVKSLL